MKFIQDIKNHFRNFGFLWQESVPVLSTNPKLLFNISGGVVFEDVIAHGVIPEHSRVVSIQPCLRTDGWRKIGISGRHHLAFDMLGHFSLYEGKEVEIKDVMIESAWRYLTNCAGIDPGSLSATVHPQDTISLNIWQGLGVRVIFNDENVTHTPTRNRCGVRTEIVWQNPNTQKMVELWNLVFTQFQGETIFVSPMEKIAADSGASIDRIRTAVECCDCDYENSSWKSVITSITERSLKQELVAIRRLADLGKAATLLISQGLKPGNKAADYVLRRIIREAYIVCRQISLSFDEFDKISREYWVSEDTVRDTISQVLTEEISRFEDSLKLGRKEYSKLISRRQGSLTEQDIEYLTSTFGYPRALIELEVGQGEKEVL